MNQNGGGDDGYYPPFNNMNLNGQDGSSSSSSHPSSPFHNRGSGQNGNFNSNMAFPFHMHQFYPTQQQAYMQQQQQQQTYEDSVNSSMGQPSQFGFNNRMAGADMNQQQRSPSDPQSLSQPDIPKPTGLPPRAVELKRQLMMAKRQNNSATPPSHSTQPISAPGASIQPEAAMRRGGPELHSQPDDTEIDNFLKETRSAADAGINIGTDRGPMVTIKKEKLNMDSDRKATQLPTRKASVVASSGLRGVQNSVGSIYNSSRTTGDRSNGQNSDNSDGEIVDDSTPRRPLPPTGPKESELSIVKRKIADDQAARERRDDLHVNQLEKKELYSQTKVHPSTAASSIRSTGTMVHEERNGTSDSRSNSKRSYQEDGGYERRHAEQRRNEHREEPHVEHVREDRSTYGVRNQGAATSTKNDREKSKSSQPVPLLERLLEQDDDLRAWLSITGYFNPEQRKKKLISDYVAPSPTLQEVLNINSDLRAWLIITKYHDVTGRDEKLAAMRALVVTQTTLQALGVPALGVSSAPMGVMGPPPTPTKVNERNVAPETNNKKRRHDDHDEVEEEDDVGPGTFEKYRKIESGSHGKIIKTEESSGEHRRRSFGEPEGSVPDARRRSASPRYNRSSSRDSTRVERGRGHSHQDHQRSYDGRVPSGSYERDRKVDETDWKTRRMNESMEPGDGRGSGRGGYRGKAYDPNYHEHRGRGINRVRGRGGYGGDVSDTPRAYGNRSGSSVHNGRETWDKGGNGDTKFYIIKSFNEENVILSQRDSVWMTQEHNSTVFAEAFKTHKNVILCYSINSSKGFQGYARMESLPGTANPPAWQQSIHWKSSGAFRVRWLTVASTHFSRVGHLKNSLNENMKVYVGKDGQEIEERAGRELCNIIDEEFDHRYSNPLIGGPDANIEGAYRGGVHGGYMRGGAGNDGGMGRGDGRGYRTYRQPGSDIGEIRGW